MAVGVLEGVDVAWVGLVEVAVACGELFEVGVGVAWTVFVEVTVACGELVEVVVKIEVAWAGVVGVAVACAGTVGVAEGFVGPKTGPLKSFGEEGVL